MVKMTIITDDVWLVDGISEKIPELIDVLTTDCKTRMEDGHVEIEPKCFTNIILASGLIYEVYSDKQESIDLYRRYLDDMSGLKRTKRYKSWEEMILNLEKENKEIRNIFDSLDDYYYSQLKAKQRELKM